MHPAPVHSVFRTIHVAEHYSLWTAGYTILDGLILFNHSAYLITDDPAPFPPISSIVSPQGINLEILSTDQAALVLGNYGGK